MIGRESSSPGAKVFGLRVPSAYFPWRQSVALLIWPRPSNVSSGPVFTTGRKPWISYLPMLHDHSSGFNTRAFAICRNVGNQEWEFGVPAELDVSRVLNEISVRRPVFMRLVG